MIKGTVIKLGKEINIEAPITCAELWKRIDTVRKRHSKYDQLADADSVVCNDIREVIGSEPDSTPHKYKRAVYAIIRRWSHWGPNGWGDQYDCAIMDKKGIILDDHHEINLPEPINIDTIKTLKLAKSRTNKKQLRFILGKSYLMV
jgi:hypothetical protein